MKSAVCLDQVVRAVALHPPALLATRVSTRALPATYRWIACSFNVSYGGSFIRSDGMDQRTQRGLGISDSSQ